MIKGDPLHVRIEYKDALISKKEILTLELLFLKINQIRKKYNVLRLKEIKIKEKIKEDIEEIKKNLEKILNNLPNYKIPKDIQRMRENKNQGKNLEEKISYSKGLDSQLIEIQIN
jgi:glycerol-3-phosphate dehydrogenase